MRQITIGMAYDLMIENQNDREEWDEIANEEDIMNF